MFEVAAHNSTYLFSHIVVGLKNIPRIITTNDTTVISTKLTTKRFIHNAIYKVSESVHKAVFINIHHPLCYKQNCWT